MPLLCNVVAVPLFDQEPRPSLVPAKSPSAAQSVDQALALQLRSEHQPPEGREHENILLDAGMAVQLLLE
jgi:hypothetical protein